MSASGDRLDRHGPVWGALAVTVVVALSFNGTERLVGLYVAPVRYLIFVLLAISMTGSFHAVPSRWSGGRMAARPPISYEALVVPHTPHLGDGHLWALGRPV